jgi:hypothetical protein
VVDWATVASALIAGVGLLFAGWQLMIMNKAAAMERRVALNGVVASWRPVEAPRAPEPDGTAIWLYEIHVHNPGRLPIDNVRVDWHFTCPVQRRRSGVLEPATKLLQLTTPVLPGGGERRWERRLVIDYVEAEAALSQTYAQVHFVDVEGRSRTTRWPRISA